jgi:hypothetical protein
MTVRDSGTSKSSGKIEHETAKFTLSLGERERVREIMTLTLHPLPEGEGDLVLPITQCPNWVFQNQER